MRSGMGRRTQEVTMNREGGTEPDGQREGGFGREPTGGRKQANVPEHLEGEGGGTGDGTTGTL